MAQRKKKRIKKRYVRVPSECPFKTNGIEPSYKNAEVLAGYLTDRGKILGKDRTGVCSKHQRLLSREIKRARHLGLLSFAPRV